MDDVYIRRDGSVTTTAVIPFAEGILVEDDKKVSLRNDNVFLQSSSDGVGVFSGTVELDFQADDCSVSMTTVGVESNKPIAVGVTPSSTWGFGVGTDFASGFFVSGIQTAASGNVANFKVDSVFSPVVSGSTYFGLDVGTNLQSDNDIDKFFAVELVPFSLNSYGGTITDFALIHGGSVMTGSTKKPSFTTYHGIHFDQILSVASGNQFYGVKISPALVGWTNVTGIELGDMDVGSGTNYAIKTGSGLVWLGDALKVGSDGSGKNLSLFGSTSGVALTWDSVNDELEVDNANIRVSRGSPVTSVTSLQDCLISVTRKTGSSSTVRAGFLAAELDNSTASAKNVVGLNSFAYHYGSGNVTGYLTGGRYASRIASNATISKAIGVRGLVEILASKTASITNAYSFFAEPVNARSGSITNAYSFYASSPVAGTGSIANAYGLYVADVSVASGANYAIKTNAGLVSFGGMVEVLGGERANITEVDSGDSPYSVADADTHVSVNSSSGSVTINLPLLTSENNGRRIAFKDSRSSAATNNITLNPSGSNTIDNQSSLVMNVNDMSISLIGNYNSGNWEVVT